MTYYDIYHKIIETYHKKGRNGGDENGGES